MGIALPCFAYLCEHAAARSNGRTCVTLGRQDVLFTANAAFSVAANAGLIALQADREPDLSVGHPLLQTASRHAILNPNGSLTDTALFNLLGYEGVDSLDASAYEGATIIADLNNAESAARVGRQFDFVLDGGTLEHVFHVPNALRNVFELLAVGGQVLHWSPASNHVDHGFYQFSPTFFYDYYSANRFDILDCLLARAGTQPNDPYTFRKYAPGSLRSISMGGLDSGRYEVVFLVRKRAESTWDAIPQQSLYNFESWKKGAQSAQ